MDQRKRSRASTNKKRAAAGRVGKPTGAFVPRVTKKTNVLQQRIEMVVARALEQETMGPGYDVVEHIPHRLRLSNASKIC